MTARIKNWKKADGTKVLIASMTRDEVVGRMNFLEQRGRQGDVWKALNDRLSDIDCADQAPVDVVNVVNVAPDAKPETRKQTAERLGISVSTLARRIKSGAFTIAE